METAKKMQYTQKGSQQQFFAQNMGQYDNAVLFYTNTGKGQYFLSKDRITCAVRTSDDRPNDRIGIIMEFDGVNENIAVDGIQRTEATLNYFLGADKTRWHSHVPTYTQIDYSNVWEGIDLSISHLLDKVKMNWMVHPHGTIESIQLRYDGADSLSIDGSGRLLIKHELGEISDEAPIAYQIVDGSKVDVCCKFKLASAENALTVGFEVDENFNPELPLIIDPLLPYSTLLGGSAADVADAVAVDALGCAYVTGYTRSVDFPVTPGAFQTSFDGGTTDVYVTKFNPEGNALIYSTFLGGDGSLDEGFSIAIDEQGNAYIAGSTESTNFPVTPGAFQTVKAGTSTNAFVTKLSPDGSSLIYSTYLGGVGTNNGTSIKVDSSGQAFICGRTTAMDFPTTPGAFDTTPTNTDYKGVISKFSSDGSSLIYSTYLTGSSGEANLLGIAIDSTGNAYVAGSTQSADFPVTPDAYQSVLLGSRSATVSILSDDGSSIVYSTYLGGSANDAAFSICIDDEGAFYVTGTTPSSDFPVTPGAAQTTIGGSSDAFVTKFLPRGAGLAYSTFLGGSAVDVGYAIDVNAQKHACVIGDTASPNFPTTPWVIPSAYSSGTVVFVTLLSEDGSHFVISYYLGGSNGNDGRGVALGPDGSIYTVGGTQSADFPITAGAFQTTLNGISDAFITRAIFTTYSKASVTLTKL